MEVKWNNHVVILYDKSKDEHVANALHFYIETEFHPCDVILVDHADYTHSVIRRFKDTTHRFAVRHARGILRVVSEKREAKALQHIKDQNSDRNATPDAEKETKDPEVARVLNVFRRFDPVMIMCTTPYSLGLALRAKVLYGKMVCVVGAVTDFALDPAFVYLNADGYFVENPEIKQNLINYGVDPTCISVIGMPSLKVDNGMTLEEKRHLLGLTDDLPVVVINGGEYNTDTQREDVALLMKNKAKFNMVIITSDKGKRRYTELPEYSAGVLFHPQLDDTVMDVADILITVPQSKAVFAAFMRGVSVVVTKAVTSHEHDVRRYLVKRALVIPSRTPMETLFAVEELLDDPERNEEFRMRGETYASMSLADIRNVLPPIQTTVSLRIEGGGTDPE